MTSIAELDWVPGGTSSTSTTSNTVSPQGSPTRSLIVLCFTGRTGAVAGITISTTCGGAWSWTVEEVHQGTTEANTIVAWARTPATPGSGTFTVQTNGVNIARRVLTVVEITGQDPGTQGANRGEASGTAATLDLTLPTAPDVSSLILSVCSSRNTTATIPYTTLSRHTSNAGSTEITQNIAYESLSGHQTHSYTSLSATTNAGIILEIIAAAAPASNYIPKAVMIG